MTKGEGGDEQRLFGRRSCVAFKDDPERYVLALRARIGEGEEESPEGE